MLLESWQWELLEGAQPTQGGNNKRMHEFSGEYLCRRINSQSSKGSAKLPKEGIYSQSRHVKPSVESRYATPRTCPAPEDSSGLKSKIDLAPPPPL